MFKTKNTFRDIRSSLESIIFFPLILFLLFSILSFGSILYPKDYPLNPFNLISLFNLLPSLRNHFNNFGNFLVGEHSSYIHDYIMSDNSNSLIFLNLIIVLGISILVAFLLIKIICKRTDLKLIKFMFTPAIIAIIMECLSAFFSEDFVYTYYNTYLTLLVLMTLRLFIHFISQLNSNNTVNYINKYHFEKNVSVHFILNIVFSFVMIYSCFKILNIQASNFSIFTENFKITVTYLLETLFIPYNVFISDSFNKYTMINYINYLTYIHGSYCTLFICFIGLYNVVYSLKLIFRLVTNTVPTKVRNFRINNTIDKDNAINKKVSSVSADYDDYDDDDFYFTRENLAFFTNYNSVEIGLDSSGNRVFKNTDNTYTTVGYTSSVNLGTSYYDTSVSGSSSYDSNYDSYYDSYSGLDYSTFDSLVNDDSYYDNVYGSPNLYDDDY